MSDLDEKLVRHAKTEGAARATLKQLMQRWGELELIALTLAGRRETWKHVTGKGLDATFEQVSP